MPYEWLFWIWITGHSLLHITNIQPSTLRTIMLFLTFLALLVNVGAIFAEDRMREDIMYTRDNILAFVLLLLAVQIMNFLSLHEMFGPFSIMIQALMLDLIRFLVILMIFMVGFTLHMAVIHKPVYGKTMVYLPTNVLPYTLKDSILIIFEELFYSCFGLANRPEPLDAEALKTNPAETYYIATFVFAIYEVVAIIVLVNLLIAMMGNTYAVLDERSSIEWKYLRANIIRMMTKKDFVPIPINVFTSLMTMLRVIKQHKCNCCNRKTDVDDDFVEENKYADGASDIGSMDGENVRGGVVTIENAVNWVTVTEDFYQSKGMVNPNEPEESDKPNDDDDDD